MNISINHLILDNFKGVSTSMLDFKGEDVHIFGANATGKTTHFDAFMWILFGKDSLNNANFEIKALDEAGTQAHNLEHSVELSLNIDGVTLALKKTYAEKWTRKRGQAAPEFTGHTTSYFMDEVPVKKKEYDEKINDLIKEDAFRLLTDARFFNEQLHWQKRRELLMDVCGDVDDQAVIESRDDLSGVLDVLDGKTLEDRKKILTSQRKAMNDELAKIPVRIDEVEKSIVDLPQKKDVVGKTKSALELQKGRLEIKLSDIKNGGEAAKIRVELQDVIAEIRKMENEFEADQAARIKKERTEADEATFTYETFNKVLSARDTEIAELQFIAASGEKKIKALREDWHKVNSETFSHAGICPTCNQDIPAEQVQEAEAKFNQGQAQKLKNIVSLGKVESARVEDAESKIEEMKKSRVQIAADRDSTLKTIKMYEDSISEIRKKQPDTDTLSKKAGDLENRLLNVGLDNRDIIAGLEKQINEKQGEIQAQVDFLNQISANEKAEKRMAELADQEKKLAVEFGKTEQALYLLEQFTRAKVDLLEEKINSKFKIARFKLFSDQINGGLTETCETVLDGVPYGSINSAGRVQVGLDIIQTLQAHHGVSCPIWIDNRESIIDLPEIDAQVISLIVSEKDPVLRVETITEKERKAA